MANGLTEQSLEASQPEDYRRILERLSPEKRALLETRLRNRQQTPAGGGQRIPRLPRKEGVNAFALSHAQERLWFLEQLDAGNSAYNEFSGVHIRGAIELELIKRTVQKIVQRHEVLRTNFASNDGTPVQLVATEVPISIPIIELTGLSEKERAREMHDRARIVARQPYDLASGILFRVVLFKFGPAEYALVYMMHHIISDAWSMGVLAREFQELYGAFLRGEQPSLPELPLQYADYAVWQREKLPKEALAGQLEYWKKQLHGIPAVLELPADGSRLDAPSHHGAMEGLLLSKSILAGLKELSRRHESTLFMTLLAAFRILLSRCTGQQDIPIGSPYANRDQPEVGNLIGFFLNLLVLRTDLGGDPTFVELLRKERETVLGAFAHSEVPFGYLVEELAPERDLNRSPLFQVLFNMPNVEEETLALAGSEMSVLKTQMRQSKYELTLYARERSAGLELQAAFNADLFAPERVRAWLEQMGVLLEQIIAAPEISIRAYSLLTPGARSVLPHADAPLSEPAQELATAWVTSWARKTPLASAITQGSRQWNYSELQTRSDSVAACLRHLEIARGDVVALFGPRSYGLIASMIGILAGGGVLLMLDPALPARRRELMLRESNAKVLISLAGDPDISGLPTIKILTVDPESGELHSPPLPSFAASTRKISGDDPAYLFFTSGTTGTPKAVIGCHKGLSHFLGWQRNTFNLQAGDRSAQLTGLSFDVVLRDILLPLISGATLCLPDEGTDKDGTLAWMARERISVLHTVPSLMESWLMTAPGELKLNHLRLTFFAGEPLRGTLVERWRGVIPLHSRVINLYGPTETTLAKCFYEVPEKCSAGVQPVGIPLPQTQVLILNGRQLCGISELGEIVIRTPFRTLGYANAPEEMRRRFVPNPFRNDAHDLVYYTGDRGRFCPDGLVEIVGRMDQQVKIRGVRVEPAEIESLLLRHPQVKSCAVIDARDEDGEIFLVAYLVMSGEPALPLREYLRQHLPSVMVPALFMNVDRLPLNANGKLDRTKLPAPQRMIAEDLAIAPRTAEEEIIAGIFRQVLRKDMVGVQEDFFELGGHSLLATRLVSRVREIFAVELPLKSLFEGPTVAALSEKVKELRSAGPRRKAPTLTRVTREQELPLSYAQERLWFLDQLETGGNLAYNIPEAMRISGPLKVEILERVVAEIVRRHEVLRTHFEVIEGRPVQVIEKSSSVKLETESLKGLESELREQRIKELAEEQWRKPFDLGKGPMLRLKLVETADQEHVLLYTLHHLVLDGWSLAVLVREFMELYRAFSANQPSPLAELPIQYADFAMWQREWLQGEILDQELEYWKQRLKGAAILELPTDRPRPAKRSYQGAIERIVINSELLVGLEELSRSQGVTLFMALSAAFKVLLSRYSAQKDIVVGTPIANRSRWDTDGLIGFFVNTVVLRTDMGGEPTFLELLRREREVAMEAYEHEDVPFERLVAELQVERDLSQNPLFQVMFALQNAPAEILRLEELEFTPMEIVPATAKFDLFFSLTETDAGLMGFAEYSTDLFDGVTIRRMVGHWERVLKEMVKNPVGKFSESELMGEEERRQVLQEWNRTEREYSGERSITELVEEQVKQAPGAVAVTDGKELLTYKQLNERANQWGHYLKELGVGPEVTVGVCLERSMEMVLAVLAVLKAGGAYVPLDPSYPSERLAFALENSRARIILTHKKFLDLIPASKASSVCLDETGNFSSKLSTENLVSITRPDNLAYVIYTSGSTGRPKGVAMCQGPLVNLLQWQLEKWQTGLPARTLQFASLNFDVSFQEIFSTWASGGTLFLVNEEVRRDSVALLKHIKEHQIERLFLPFIALKHLAETALSSHSLPESLKEVITAGEQLKLTPDLSQFFARLNGCALENQYGPSETHVVTAYRLTGPCATWPALPPIGRPIGNTQIYILDEKEQPVPIGVRGELHIGGMGLARGYLNRAEWTAEKFIPNEWSEEPGQRLYRTGDLARHLLSGEIEYLGRIDQQVKVRGFRVEPGEIETRLAEHPAVGENAVVVREDQAGEKQLVGYVVMKDNGRVGELKKYLKERLPEYMVPAFIVTLTSLPLTANGKLDRKRLPAPERNGVLETYLAPRTAVEEILAGIYQEVLRVERVGVEDDFFGLGGHSLLATRLVSRVRESFGVELPLRSLFESSSVEALAEKVEELRTKDHGLKVPPMVKVERGGALPLSYAQERLWLLYLIHPDVPFNMRFIFRIEGHADIEALRKSFHSIFKRHEMLRTSFRAVKGVPTQVIEPDPILEIPLIELHDGISPEKEAQRLIEEHMRRPFDLGAGPLLRSRIFRLGPDHHIFMLVIHHILADGWSMGVLMREFVAFYESFSKGTPCALPELPIQYADFATWQRNWLQGEILASQLEYWKAKLGTDLPVLELPADRPSPAVRTRKGAVETFAVDKKMTDQLRRLSQRSGVTLFMTLLAAFDALLYRYTGQEDICVGTHFANRNRKEAEGLIGFFINRLLLRSDLSGNPVFADLLRQTREVALQAYKNQDIPFEHVVAEIKRKGNLNRVTICQVMIVLENELEDLPAFSQVKVTAVESSQPISDVDMYLSFRETPDGLHGSLQYSTDIFDRSRIVQIISHLQAIFDSVTSNPQQRLLDLDILGQDERRKLLEEWNETAVTYPEYQSLVDPFEEQVEQRPLAIAIAYENQKLTYRELNERSNRLANHLQKLGVGPDVLVGICLERSLEMVVGLLGILKAGGAYVPLDPHYPQERLMFLLKDAGPKVLLTQKRFRERLEGKVEEIICLDDWMGEGAANPKRSVHRKNMAYMIYTSGSTGNPKGAMNTHEGILNRLQWMQDAYRLGDADRVLQKTPYTFDVSVWEFFWPLITGARLVIAQPEGHKDVPYLIDLIEKEKITTVHFVPPMLQVFLEGLKTGNCGGLKRVICSGEALKKELAERFFERLPGDLHNLYGPTEASVDVTYWQCPRKMEGEVVPIGKPIANTTAYILDKNFNPVPLGVIGELHLGGVGLGRGYLGRVELTAEKFVPHPFGREPGERLYRTGDLARYSPAGDIEFLGRVDHQVKIRGFRIELGEIEAMLNKHPVVKQAVVTVQDASGEKRLAAYIIKHSGSEASAEELKSYLKQKLPEYMVPAFIMIMDSLPLTSNGKIDRRQLPAFGATTHGRTDFVAPETPVEKELEKIWRRVLKVEQIGTNYNFFDLGGHSLMATQIITQIRDVFNIELPLRTLFTGDFTIAGLAQIIVERQLEQVDQAEIADFLKKLEGLPDDEE